jgi:RecA-family ATPase
MSAALERELCEAGQRGARADEFDEIIARHRRAHDGPETIALTRVASSVAPRELAPLWPGVLWIGKPTMFVGDPGLGKSLVTVDAAARVTRETPWPCETEAHEPGDVLMVSAEDDPEDTIVPRLIAAGADLDRVTFLEGVRTIDYDRGQMQEHPLALDQHLAVLRETIVAREHRGRPVRLLIVDPISAFLGGTDSHQNAEVRVVLAALGRLAAELRFAVLVVSHLNKASGANAVYRVSGSLAFVAAARCVYAIARDPDDQDARLMLPIKSNLGPDQAGYRYTISVADNDAPYVRWSDERETRTAEEVLAGQPSPREQAVIERTHETQDWLRRQLESGPQPATSIYRAAERDEISQRDLRRAKRALGIRAEVQGYQGAWHWSLPAVQSGTP